MRLRLFLLATLLASTLAARADHYDKANFERVLLPIHPLRASAGAFGTLWDTEFTAFNFGTQPVEMFQSRCSQLCTCSFSGTCSPDLPVQPNAAFHGFTSGEDESSFPNPASFLYVERDKAENVAFALRLFDAGHPKATFGTAIPVVRERDQRTGKVVLLGIPTDAAYRQHLRVYGISSTTGASDVFVRVFDGEGAAVLAERTLHIVPSERLTTLPGPDDFPRFPGYAEILPLVRLLPDNAPARVRIEITPLEEGLVYWACVSVTSNETQEVTLITPQ